MNNPLVSAFESGNLQGHPFHHREHLFVAWCYLCEFPLEEALARYVHHLRALTLKLGVPQKFHATITWAWVVLLHDAMRVTPGLPFDALLERHPQLLKRDSLHQHFAPEELERGRDHFRLPRRA